ncbi:MAG TPA: DUF6496 domain-containing protein, partial [Terriglobales bacterium]
REEIHHVREGKHGARSTKQAIAIGLSKARRAGVRLQRPKGSASVKTKAAQDEQASRGSRRKKSSKRSQATSNALKREGRKSASRQSLSRHAKQAAVRRGKPARRAAAAKAAQTRKTA